MPSSPSQSGSDFARSLLRLYSRDQVLAAMSPPPTASTARPTPTPSDPADPPFALYGGNAQGFNCRDPEVLLAGPAGTGKTLAWLVLVRTACRKYPGARVLVVRKTRASLTESVLNTWERDVLGPGHPAIGRQISRTHRHGYKFPNGSEVVLGGMDKADKVLSSEWDLIYCPEATDLALVDWETLIGRLRSGPVPHKQIVGDCNPTTPQHWLYKRCTEVPPDESRPLCTLIPTLHQENPRLYDRAAGAWTAEGEDYIGRKLGRLTGPRRTRFLLGKWERAEGLIWEAWDPDVHLVDWFLPARDWPRYLVVDFGYSVPFCCQFWARDPGGAVWMYREIYKTKELVEDHARRIRELLEREGLERPRAVVCDPADREGRETLARHLRVRTVAADKDTVLAGIQEAAELFAPADDGKPRLYICRDALAHDPDPDLKAAGKPTCTREELDGYIWDPNCKKGERPLDQDNHGCDCVRYFAKHLAARGGGGGAGTGTRAESPHGDIMARRF